MDFGIFELDGCTLQHGSGVGEALDAAGVDGTLQRPDSTGTPPDGGVDRPDAAADDGRG